MKIGHTCFFTIALWLCPKIGSPDFCSPSGCLAPVSQFLFSETDSVAADGTGHVPGNGNVKNQMTWFFFRQRKGVFRVGCAVLPIKVSGTNVIPAIPDALTRHSDIIMTRFLRKIRSSDFLKTVFCAPEDAEIHTDHADFRKDTLRTKGLVKAFWWHFYGFCDKTGNIPAGISRKWKIRSSDFCIIRHIFRKIRSKYAGSRSETVVFAAITATGDETSDLSGNSSKNQMTRFYCQGNNSSLHRIFS